MTVQFADHRNLPTSVLGPEQSLAYARPAPAAVRCARSGVNVNDMERAASALAAGTLLLFALRPRSAPVGRALAGLAGGALLYRGVSGHCHLYQALGVNSANEQRKPRRIWREEHGAPPEASDVQHSITIGKSAEELYRLWRDPVNLNLIMGHFAEVSESGEYMHWRLRAPLGKTLEWDTRIASERASEFLRWESLPGAQLPNVGSVQFSNAPGDWGTVVRLHFRFDPPGGAVGRAASKLLGVVPLTLVKVALRRFKSLAETGEIPTTFYNPAARAGALAG